MKKALALLSVSMLLQPALVFAEQTNTDKTCSKTCHHKHHCKHHSCSTCGSCKKDVVVTKDKAPTEPVKKDTKYAWMDNLTGNFDFTSNYIFRGESQSANLPAAQGGLTYTFPIGLYLNAWGSNVKFPGTNATLELDAIIGWHGTTFKDALTYDINLDRYNYPGAHRLNYNELNTLFNYKFLQLGVSYSANAYGSHQTGIYYNGGINYDIPPQYIFNIQDLNLTALLGHYSLPRAAGNSYNDYQVNLTKKFRTYALMVQWVSTNGRQHNSPYDGSQIVGTLTANF